MNYKKALLPIMISIVVSGGLSGCSKDKTAGEYLNNAQVFLQQDKNAEAIISLKNLLKNDSTNAKGRFLLGKAYANQGDWLAAEKEFSKANKYNYNVNKVLPLLAHVYYRLGKSEAIDGLFREIEKNKLDITVETKLTMNTFLAISHIRQGKNEVGQLILSEIIEQKIDSKYTQLSTAWLKGTTKNLPQALNVIEQILQDSPKFLEALEYKGHILFAMNKMTLAAGAFKKYVMAQPEASQARLMLALSLVNSSKFLEAEKHAKLLQKINKNHPIVNQIIAQARFYEKDYVKAKEHAEITTLANGTAIISRIIAGFSSYQLNQPEIAYDHLLSIKDNLSYKHPGIKLLHVLRLQLGYVDEAYQELANLPKEKLDVQFFASSAIEFFKLGENVKAEKLLAKVNEAEPENSKIIYQQGLLKLLNNDKSSQNFFELALQKDPNLNPATAMLVVNKIKEKKYDEAIQLTTSLKKSNPLLFNVLNGLISRDKKDYLQARYFFQSVLSLDSDNPVALTNLAEIHQYENNTLAAVTLYKQILTTRLGFMPALRQLLKLANNVDVQVDIELFLQQQIVIQENKALAYLVLSEFYAIKGDLDKMASTVSTALDKMPNDHLFRLIKARNLAVKKQYIEAMVLIDKVLIVMPNNIKARVMRSNILRLQDKLDLAIEEQQRIVKLVPNDLSSQLHLARLYYENQQLNMVLLVLNPLRETAKSNGIYTEMRGKVAFAQKNFAEAVPFLTHAYQQYNTATLLVELVQALQNVGDNKQAIKLLNDRDTKQGGLKNITLLLKFAFLITEQNPEKALALYQKVQENRKVHFTINNNMALLYLRLNKPKEGLLSAKMAIDAAKNIPQVQDTYGIALLATNNNTQALNYISKAYKADPKNTDHMVHYAQILVVTGKSDAAKNIVNKIIRPISNPDTRYRLTQVEAVLVSLE